VRGLDSVFVEVFAAAFAMICIDFIVYAKES
jgi:hypothetical protein